MSQKLTPDQPPDAWSAVAEAYDRFSQQVTLLFAEDAARLVRIERGTRVLDVAAGTGNFAFAAARLGARVLATDFAPGMLARLLERARGERLTVETAVMDGQALDLSDRSFDVAAFVRAIEDDFRSRQGDGPYALTHEGMIAVGIVG